MTFNEWKVLVKGLKAVFTSDKFLPDEDSIKIWFQLIGDIDYKTCNAAIQKYILTNKFPPTIADIRELSSHVTYGNIKDWSDAWHDVQMAIRRFGYYQQVEAMASLDDVTRSAVERIGFTNLCMSENADISRANFRMIYEAIAQRKQTEQQIPDRVKNLIADIQNKQDNLLGMAKDGDA